MKTNNLLIWGAVAVGAYLLYTRMKKTNSNPTGRELAPPPISGGSVKPPLTQETENAVAQDNIEGL